MKTRAVLVKSDYSFSAHLKRLVFLLLPRGLSIFLFRRFIDENRERNKLEAAKFLIDANNIYSTRYYKLLPKFLKFALGLADSGLPDTYINILTERLLSTRKNPSSRTKICQEILIETLKLSPRQTSAQSWKLISLALSGFGFIRAGTVARDNCFKAALDEVSNNQASDRTLNLAIRGLLENRMFDEARTCIEKHALRLSSSAINDVYGIYLELMKQKRPNVVAPVNERNTPEDRFFAELVTGKTVALIAPGVINTESGAEIDSHDTVARIKFNGVSAMPEAKLVGRRCDMTSHNTALLTIAARDSDFSNIFKDGVSDLKLLIAKKGSFNSINSLPVKSMNSWPPTFLTTGTSGTLLIFDLLKAFPNKIKMFGFDFYSNRNIYDKAMLENYQSSKAPDGDHPRAYSWDGEIFSIASIARSHISHDLKSDFLFIKNLYELSGLIDGTPEVLALLNLTANEYDTKLETMLGDW